MEKERKEIMERIDNFERRVKESEEEKREGEMLMKRIERLEKEGVEQGRKRIIEKEVGRENERSGENDGKGRKGKRKRNLVFKSIKIGEKGDIRGELEKIGREIGMKLEVEEIRKVRMWREEKAKMVIVKVKSGGSRIKILENNKKFRGREVWIEVDF